MKKTHGKNKRIQLLVNQNHGLENVDKITPKRQWKSDPCAPYVLSNFNGLSGTHTTMSFISFSLSIIVHLLAATIAGYTFL